MPIFRLATSRETRNPVRVQQFNGSMRAGDDLKIALTVYRDDVGTPADVTASRSQVLLWPDERAGAGLSWDYGLGWFTGAVPGPGFPVQVIAGWTTPVRSGGINFALPAEVTAGLWFGRYRLSIQVDMADGEFSQVEGVLQVRERFLRQGIGHVPLSLAGLSAFPLVDGLPVDADGFFLLRSDFLERAPGVGDFNTDFTYDFNR